MAPITSCYVSSHISPQGPGDARPTAIQVIQDEGLVDKWTGKTVLVTGANDTTGLETARALHLTGARTFLTTRSAEKGAVAVRSIIDSNGGEKAGVEAITMELGDLSSVRNAAKEFMSRSESLNVLVCNAGVLAQEFGRTKDNFEMDFGVNHVGHFALFQELKQCLISSSTDSFNSRVVMVASIGHRMSEIYFDDPNFDHRSWDVISAYGQSKTANIYMANYIDRTYGTQGLHAWSLQPGGIISNLVGKSEEVKQAMISNSEILPWLKTPQQGAATSVWAAIARDLEGKGGRYLESMQEIGEWQGPEEKRVDWTDPGYASHAYDKEKEDKLWAMSEKLIC
ncbi:NAD(P)-binding protein [Hyaloscypha variabilis]|uniref:NAD(P)-binding protein n=1 Tax=Hyaloscypha variabilis (strain UAMH 11265 / GT02V1 / F) TaxID=1149755 RepID=A0A2J6RK86_HYAVF|nr:NAD(P)-binding protein [Hyaloscypha variabilis F]